MWADGVVFLIVSVLMLTLVRRPLRQRLSGKGALMGIKALEGKSALVLDRSPATRAR